MGNILRRVAIVLGLVSALVFSWIHRVESPSPQGRVPTAPVVVAQKDMPEGAAVDRMGVVVAQWPVGTIPAGAFSTVDSVAGRVTRVAIFRGEVLVPGRLTPVGTASREIQITPGKRAVSFRVDDVSGIAGLVQPNSRVDIVLVVNGGTKKGGVAKVFMENMRILAMNPVSQHADDGPINAAVATVEVTPSEGERLAIATRQGQFQVMLRGYGDPDSTKAKGATTSQIEQGLNSAPSPRPYVLPFIPPRPRKPDTNTVTIYRERVEQRKFHADSAGRDSLGAKVRSGKSLST